MLNSQSRVTAASTTAQLSCLLNDLPGLTSCRCNNIGLVSLIFLGWELRVLYHCTMCTRHPDLVSLDFYAIPIFPLIYLKLFLRPEMLLSKRRSATIVMSKRNNSESESFSEV